MGTKLSTTDYAPTAVLKNGKDGIDRKGHMIRGVYAGKRSQETSYGLATIYALRVKEATCDFMKDDQLVTPAEDTLVEFFGTTVINNAMQNPLVKEGCVLTCTYRGLGTKKKKGNAPHLYNLEVE